MPQVGYVPRSAEQAPEGAFQQYPGQPQYLGGGQFAGGGGTVPSTGGGPGTYAMSRSAFPPGTFGTPEYREGALEAGGRGLYRNLPVAGPLIHAAEGGWEQPWWQTVLKTLASIPRSALGMGAGFLGGTVFDMIKAGMGKGMQHPGVAGTGVQPDYRMAGHPPGMDTGGMPSMALPATASYGGGSPGGGQFAAGRTESAGSQLGGGSGPSFGVPTMFGEQPTWTGQSWMGRGREGGGGEGYSTQNWAAPQPFSIPSSWQSEERG